MEHGSGAADDMTNDLKNKLECKLLFFFGEAYGTERVIRAAHHSTNDLKIDLECRSGAVAVLLSAGYQETAAYCQFGWEPHWKKIASTSMGKAPGTSASISQSST